MAQEGEKERLREEIAQEKFGKSFEELDSDEVSAVEQTGDVVQC